MFGQKKLLKWSIPGAAHFFVFWAFLILGTVYLEAYGILLSRNPELGDPDRRPLGPARLRPGLHRGDGLVGLATFALIRLRKTPEKLGRKSRFSGSHLGRRVAGAVHDLQRHLDDVPVPRRGRGRRQLALRRRRLRLDRRSASSSTACPRHARDPRGRRPAAAHRRHAGLPDRSCVHSKHLHIFVAPLNVLFARRPQSRSAPPSR